MVGRFRAAFVTLWSAPWRRAPLLLWRHPGVLATVAGACAVTAASVAAVPLFLSSVGTESVALQVAERCPRDTGATFLTRGSAADVRAPAADPFVPLADKLAPASRWARLDGLSLVGSDPAQDLPATVLARDGALDHLDVVDGPAGPGVWISDFAAERTGLRTGSLATVGGFEVPVAGIYRDFSGSTVDRYWCSNADLVLWEVRGPDIVRPPSLVVADRDTLAKLLGRLDVSATQAAWEAHLRDDLLVADAEELVLDLACSTEGAVALRWCADGQPLVPRTRSGFLRLPPLPARDDVDFVERYFRSHLPFVTERSRAIQTSVAGGVWPVAGFAALAGVGLVAAAASLWFDRRRREVTLLTVRGVSPAGLGAKAVLELALPSLVGVLGGIALAYGIVVWLGPSPVLERAAIGRAALAGAGALVGALIVVAAVVARRVSAHGARRARRVRLGALPWELGLGWMTLVSYRRLGDWGVPVGRGANVSHVDVWGLLFPVLFIVTSVAVLSRVLALVLRPLRSASGSWPTVLYLAVRRVARSQAAVLGLVAAAATAAGVLGYATTMNRSLDSTLDAKAATFVGSDVAITLASDGHVPAELAEHATEVQVHGRAWIVDAGRRVSVSVLAIDPASFERIAFWDATFADSSLGDILDGLEVPVEDGRIPAVLVGTEVDQDVEVGVTDGITRRFTIEPIAGVDAFAGMRRAEPTVYVAAANLEDFEIGGVATEVWISGDRGQTLAALAAAGTAYIEPRQRDEVASSSAFVTVSWTFGFMRSLGISAGVLVLGGVAVYLDARRRDRLLGYAFMRRMGLSGRQHRGALVLELTASVLVGCWVGLGIALVAARLAHQRIDPVPGFDPAPLLRPASSMIITLAVSSLVLAGVAAALAQRRIDRDDPVEVLRAGV